MRRKVLKILFVILLAFLLASWSSSADGAKYEYDALNRLVRVVYDETTTIEYTYDAAGNRSRRVSTLLADVSIDGVVNLEDFARLAIHWLNEDCISPGWCDRADIDWSTEVDIEDVSILARLWLEDTWP
jgi:YD repeat-containing protein